MSGFLVTFEGTEGCGKSTQLELLCRRLKKTGIPFQLFREPGGTAAGEEIRHLLKHSDSNRSLTPEAELLLMNASRAQLVRESIRPALARGELVLCDRFYDSTLVYQGYGRGLDFKQVRQVIEIAVGETRPHLTFLLHLPLSISENRQARRAEQGGSGQRDRFEEADREFFMRVEEGYLELAKSDPGRFAVIDGTLPMEVIENEIWKRLEALLRGSSASRR